MKNFAKKLALGIASVISIATALELDAQNLNNQSCGRVANTGTIRFRNSSGQFQNAAPVANVDNANGVIDMTGTNNLFTGSNPLGSSASNRIPGIVLWSSTNPAQNVQGRFYSSLNVSGGTKNMLDSIFVGNVYTIAASTGTRTYNGTFRYDGTVAQTIQPENGVNSYNNLALLNGATGNTKTLNGTATVNGTFLNDASNNGGASVGNGGTLNLQGASTSRAPFNITGTDAVLNLINGANSSLLVDNNSTLLADNGGRVNVSSTAAPAAMIIQNGSTYRLGSNGVGGQFYLTGTANMNVFGTYQNSLPALTNAFYECGTTVRYLATAAGQTIQATSAVDANRYGKLETMGGNKITNGDVHVKCGLAVNPNNGPIHQIQMGSNTMFVHNGGTGTTNVAYDGTLADCQSGSEIVGNMQRDIPTPAGTSAYTYNNRYTTVAFTNGTAPATLAVNALPNTNPNQYVASSDVNRKITVTYPAGAPWNATVRAGFRPSEAAALSGLANLNNLRTYNDPTTGAPNRIGNNITRNTTTGCEFYYLETQNISNNGANTLGSGNDLLFRGGPTTVFSARPGRWSNPETWADGAEPLPFDSVVIRHNVWAGFTRPTTSGWDGYSTPEAYPNAMAQSVRIQTLGGDSTGALIFGLDATAPANNGLFIIGGAQTYVPNSTIGTNATLSLEECNTTGTLRSALSATNLNTFRTTLAAQPKERGLVIFGSTTANQPTVRVNNISNTGWIQNGSVLEIGD